MRNIGLKVMIIFFSVFVLCLLSGCGSDGSNGDDGQPCIVEQLEDGVYISCPDSDTFIPSEDSDEDSEEQNDSDDVVECKRGEGHKKHDHTKHEPCED